jgi:apolipoprotein N-acyltransferase
MSQAKLVQVKRLLTNWVLVHFSVFLNSQTSPQFLSLFFLSWLIVSLGQPAWIPYFCPVAAACGFALLWLSLRGIKKGRFWWATGWYACVQLIQLSWLTSIDYQGYYILGVYGTLSLVLGMQFGLLTQFFLAKPKIDWTRILAAASLWVLMEWSRLFVLCGFSWNPVGLAMTSMIYPLQFANLWGIYGLSFWVILVNAAVYRLLSNRELGGKNGRRIGLWVALALLPYLYGYVFVHCCNEEVSPPTLSVGLVQTGLMPSQKVPLPGREKDFIAPLDQWKRILVNLQSQKTEWDLLIFPEAVVPMRADLYAYPYEQVISRLQGIYGPNLAIQLPFLKPPFAQQRILGGKFVLCVSNAFMAQAIANIHGAEVVIGLDHFDPISRRHFNSAFHFLPMSHKIQRYDKQVLLPLAEYLPFTWLKSLTSRYGITEFFSQGKETRVLGERIPFSLSICYEETFPNLIRDGRLEGAQLFVNVTNDNYYPFSRLPEQHFTHARLRSVENGVPLLRACNTGVTAGIDRFGRTISRLAENQEDPETFQGTLNVELGLESHKTLYMFWGDAGIIGLAMLILLVFCCFKIKIHLSALAGNLNLKKMGP